MWEWLRDNWKDNFFLRGTAEAVLALVATWSISSLVEIPLIRDFGIVVVWMLVLLLVGRSALNVDSRHTPPSGADPSTADGAGDPELEWVSLNDLMEAIPGVREKYPDLLGITPPSQITALADYIQSWYRERRLARPADGPEAVRYDNETLIDFELEWEQPLEAAREHLAFRGVTLDTTVNDLVGIREMIRRLREASDFRKWPR